MDYVYLLWLLWWSKFPPAHWLYRWIIDNHIVKSDKVLVILNNPMSLLRKKLLVLDIFNNKLICILIKLLLIFIC